ncbi:hypothetical protein NQZ68_030666 [Dissostichus eleginoides]|nr:hypothetical protein NQZ68_030666 [Dissostichus eleginoides]
MAAGSSGAVAAVYLCMVVLNLGPLFGYTTHLAPLIKQHAGDTSLFAPATWLNINHFGHGRHVIYSTFTWHSWHTLSNTKKGHKRKKENIGLLALLCLLLSGDIHPCPGPGVVSIDLTAGSPAAELHTPPAGFRRGWLAEQLAPPAGLCGLALTAADLAAGPLPTPSEDYGGGRIAPTPSENCGTAPGASGLAAEIHALPAGFRRGKLAEQLALPTCLSGLALTATGLAAGSISTPSEDWGPAPKAKGIAAEIHASPAGFRRGKLAEQLALPEDCGSAPMASSLATENHKPTASSVCSTINNGTEDRLDDVVGLDTKSTEDWREYLIHYDLKHRKTKLESDEEDKTLTKRLLEIQVAEKGK